MNAPAKYREPPAPTRDFRQEELELANKWRAVQTDELSGRLGARKAATARRIIGWQLRAVQAVRKAVERRAAGRKP
ncbi:MAG: hypothetical protein ABMA26_15320 [Limisphaerales bacterium]